MSRVEEGRESLLRSGQAVSRRAKQTWEDFTDFIFQDNVLEVALGLMSVGISSAEACSRSFGFSRVARRRLVF